MPSKSPVSPPIAATAQPPQPSRDPSAHSPDEQRLLAVIRQYWGYDEFRPLQRRAMANVVAGRDSVVVLPTGGGKSLIFQAPALLPEGPREQQGLAVVISPLISLMKDQVDGLLASGVPAAYFNSTLTVQQRRAVRAELEAGTYRLLYVAPERLAGAPGQEFRQLLRRSGVRYIAIDEAHCISQWGHDFRPDYRLLGELRDAFPRAAMHAFTATASQRVRQDIAEQLHLRQPEMLVGSFDRPNLTYRVFYRSSFQQQLRRVLERHQGEAGIIYCISRKEVERVAARLVGWGYSALPYHAGLDGETRHRNQEEFLNERVDVVVATVAFGMGIDRSNVRFVVHAGSPRSVEHYQQESGRAGRDGLAAECVLFYSAGDFMTWRRLMEGEGQLSDSANHLLNQMQNYAAATRCRHKALVEYFDQPYEADSCAACDWCLGELERIEDSLVVARKILSCVYRVRQRFGVGHVVDVLRGRATAKVRARSHDELSTFGLLENLPVAELRGYVEQLVDQGFLEQVGAPYPTLSGTESGLRLLKAEEDCLLFRQHRPEPAQRQRRRAGEGSRATTTSEGESWQGVDRGLFDKLREARLELAREREVPPYLIFHDSTLRDMARRRPSSETSMLGIYGVGDKKAKNFGPIFLSVIRDYCQSHLLRTDAY